ncbi:MAG: LamG-like jellyroll fold domain-containing protein, partial [Opitutales bacterium]
MSYQGIDIEGNEVHAEVSGGEAIFLDPFGVLTPLDMPLGTFAGSADLASRSLENAQKRRSAWMEMSQQLASDKKTLLYYNFDGHDSWSRVLQDKTKRNKGSGDGAVIGCKWAEGRWPGKGALQFSKNNDRVCLNISESLQQATLVAWVKLDSLNREGAPIVFSKPHFKGAFGWSVNPLGKLVLEIDTGNSLEKYESAVAFSQDRVGRWIHLATSFDGEN